MSAPQKRPLGLWMTSSLIIGNMIGAGVFLLPASLATFGTIGLIGWIVTGLGAISLALVFGRLASHYPETGGPYAYGRHVFGDFMGFQLAWSYWTANWVSNAALAVAFVSYGSHFFPELSSPFYGLLTGLGLVWGLTLLNSWSLKAVGEIQILLTVVKLIPLLAVALGGLFFLNTSHFTPFNPTDLAPLAAINGAATIALFAFVGLESGTVPADCIDCPEKTIPRATIIGTVLAATVYILVMVGVMGIVPPDVLKISKAPLADAARILYGDWAGSAIAIGAMISCIGTLNGWILLQGQVPLAAARDKLFPEIFARLSPQGIPVFGLVFSSLLISGLLYLNHEAHMVDQFTALVTLTTFAMLLPYLYSSMADLMLIIAKKETFTPFRFIRAIGISIVGFSYSLWAAYGAGQEVVYMGTLFLFCGIPVYILMKKDKAKDYL